MVIDVAAKIPADNITSLMCDAAAVEADLPACSRKCNRPYAATLMHRPLPRLVLFIGDVAQIIANAIALLGATPHRVQRENSKSCSIFACMLTGSSAMTTALRACTPIPNNSR